MNIRPNPGPLPVNSDTEPKGGSLSKSFKRQLNFLDSDDPHPAKLPSLAPVATCSPEGNINARSVTTLEPFIYSDADKPCNMIPWGNEFECIHQSLMQEEHQEIEAQVNALSDAQIQSLFTVTRPSQIGGRPEPTNSLIELAVLSEQAGRIFFQVLFDRLSSEELRHALLEPFDDNETFLHLICRVIDKPLLKKLEEKIDRQTLFEMLTQPINNLAPPLAFACLYNKSTHLFYTVFDEKRELIVKLLKGSPDIDQSILQFMCNDSARPGGALQLTTEKYYQRIKYLLHNLTPQDRFDAIQFTGKSNESALLWACTGTRLHSDELVLILTEELDDVQKARLCTLQSETGHSLIQKCLELNKLDKVASLCMTLHDQSLRFKVLSICTWEGHSFFKQWLLNSNDSNEENIEYMLRGMNAYHRILIIAGDRSIWDQAIDGTDHQNITRQQEQTPIVETMNSKKMDLAECLWKQIADPELRIKLLLYKTKHQTTLLQHMLDVRGQWDYFKYRIMNTSNEALQNSFAAELYRHALAAERFVDAEYYFSQISDTKLKHDLSNDPKYFLMSLSRKTEADIERFFSQETPSQCTESVIYILEQTLYNKKSLPENLLHFITLQKDAVNKDTFSKWATSPQQGGQCPITIALSRSVIAYRKWKYPQEFKLFSDRGEHREMLACLNMQIFQGIVRTMSEEKVKEFFLSLQDDRYKVLHLVIYKEILKTIVYVLGDSGKAFLEQINPATGGNVLHILFESSLINSEDTELNDIINTVNWLDENYGLTLFLQARLKNDGSTPLHLLFLATANPTLRSQCINSQTLQEHILNRLCQPNADALLLVELFKLKDDNGCTPLHNFFSCKYINNKIGDLLIQKLGLETFFKLMHIKDNQGNTVMDHFSKRNNHLHEKYQNLFETLLPKDHD
ncbi:hypothetical protein [Endozoicomonas sp. 8E]|uniref:hypothetical protein n=1 Tax=Endozoicomonas sp. 8E TaxID=3035692 RepID=UPI00293918E6|nr:hypothetical protein [Endozoicomonas sp. 8E]WOG26841.1 hypothetical protein P6910_20175 [Endozoicomonas sp. 8E]